MCPDNRFQLDGLDFSGQIGPSSQLIFKYVLKFPLSVIHMQHQMSRQYYTVRAHDLPQVQCIPGSHTQQNSLAPIAKVVEALDASLVNPNPTPYYATAVAL